MYRNALIRASQVWKAYNSILLKGHSHICDTIVTTAGWLARKGRHYNVIWIKAQCVCYFLPDSALTPPPSPALSPISFALFFASSTRRSVAPKALEYDDAARVKNSPAFTNSSLVSVCVSVGVKQMSRGKERRSRENRLQRERRGDAAVLTEAYEQTQK